MIERLMDRLQNGGGLVKVNADGSLSLSPKSGQNATLASGQLLLPGGAVGAPSLAFSAETGMGFWRAASNKTRFALGGADILALDDSGIQLSSTTAFRFSSGAVGSSSDLQLWRDAAGTLAQRNGASAQAGRIYNTYTDASNYERLNLAWSGNTLSIDTSAAGTGTARDIAIGTSGSASTYLKTNATNRWQISTVGHLLAATDNAYDIGAGGAFRPRDFYLSRNAVISGTLTMSGQILTGNGSAGSPAYAFTGESNTGMYTGGLGQMIWSSFGTPVMRASSPAYTPDRGLTLYTDYFLGWPSGDATGTYDVALRRDGSGVLAQRNGSSAQNQRVYNTYTDGSNNEYAGMGWSGNVFQIGTVKNGTGTLRGLRFGFTGNSIGFYGVTPVARQVLATGAGATVDNVITALQNLGLVSQT